MRRLALVLVLVGAAAAACGGSSGHADPTRTPLPSGSLGVVAPDAAARTVSALCTLSSATDRSDANSSFYDDAHQELHVIAAATSDVDRAAAAGLLVTMQRVEADLATTALPTGFPSDVEALRVATVRAIHAIGLTAPACGP
jgi:hypothetical protein